MEGFGDRLRKLRRDADLTQGELAEKLGVVPSAVGKYERLPHSYPSVEVLIKLSDFFNVSTDFLLKGITATAAVENNISGELNNGSLVQANHGGVVVNDGGNRILSPEVSELLRIYEKLNGRGRLSMLNFAVELERETGNEIQVGN